MTPFATQRPRYHARAALNTTNRHPPPPKKRGVDVLLNAESERETPAMVSFGDQQRFIGVHAAGKVRVCGCMALVIALLWLR
jgi:hypothetical protein